MNKGHHTNASAITGTVLVFVGIVLEGTKLGLWPVKSWIALVALWPVIIIAVGIRMLLPRRRFFGWAMIISLVVIVGVVISLPVSVRNNIMDQHVALTGSGVQGGVFHVAYNPVKTLDINGDFGATILNMSGMQQDDTAALIEGTYDTGTVTATNTQHIDVAHVHIQQTGGWYIGRGNTINVRISNTPLINLTLSTGASNSNIDLSGLRLKTAKIHTGATELNLTLGNVLNMQSIKLDVGASSVSLKVPEHSGLRIISRAGLSFNNFDSAGLKKIGIDDYESSNYSTAAKRIIITLDGSASSVTLARY